MWWKLNYCLFNKQLRESVNNNRGSELHSSALLQVDIVYKYIVDSPSDLRYNMGSKL